LQVHFQRPGFCEWVAFPGGRTPRRSHRFELCAEITAKVRRRRLSLLEVPISYRPRTALEGKKIGWRDACSTVWTLLKRRFLPLPSRGVARRRIAPTPAASLSTAWESAARL
jgi:hypothetical protein